VLRAAPSEVRLLFSEAIEPAFSRIQVFDQAGQRVDAGGARADPRDARRLRVALKQPLAPGTYRVAWRAVSVDTHVSSGDFAFTLAR
jgi:methionine-rich copper-binding protein CopC